MKSFWTKLFAKQPAQVRTADCGTFRVKLRKKKSLRNYAIRNR